jgi:hypothetical protein
VKVATKKKTPGKPKGKISKSVPPSKTRAGLRPKKEKLFRLEVGKTYESRCGRFKAKITGIDKGKEPWPYIGEWVGTAPRLDQAMVSPFWNPRGLIFCDEEPTDLVREVVKARGK